MLNDSESMNSLLKDVHRLPITYMIKMTWRKVTKWFYLCCLIANAMINTLTLSIEEEISKSKEKVRFQVVHPDSINIF